MSVYGQIAISLDSYIRPVPINLTPQISIETGHGFQKRKPCNFLIVAGVLYVLYTSWWGPNWESTER